MRSRLFTRRGLRPARLGALALALALVGVLTFDAGVAPAGGQPRTPADGGAAEGTPTVADLPPFSPGWKIISNRHTPSRCLYKSAGEGERPILGAGCRDLPPTAADFGFELEIIDGYYNYYIVRIHTGAGLCVAARGKVESPAIATTCGNWADQKWRLFWDSTDSGYRYQNVNSDLCLVLRTHQQQAMQTPCGPWQDQVWSVSPY